MTEMVYKILSCVGGLCTLISIILSIIIGKTKNKKVKADCDNALTFLFKIQEVIAKAEEMKNWTGNEKKQFAFSMLYNEASKYGIDNEHLDNLIEQFVYFTKQVNTNKGDKPNE